MSPQVALLLYLGLIGWLFWQDIRRRGKLSPAIWVVLPWITIMASKPFSLWFGGGLVVNAASDYLEGSPVDRLIFLSLIVCAIWTLVQRRLDWSTTFLRNRAVFLFYGYLLLSAVWSDYSFVSFKRCIKEIGNLLMVLIILSDKNPIQFLKAVTARCIYVVVPMSILLIKYFPELGRSYDLWTGTAFFHGVAQGKNSLGMVCFTAELFLIWMIVALWGEPRNSVVRREIASYVILLIMCIWLLNIAQSATSRVCAVLAPCLFFWLRWSAIRQRSQRIAMYLGSLVLGAWLIDATFNVKEAVFEVLGRSATISGRTGIWSRVIELTVNPIFGTGFATFWLGDRAEIIWSELERLTQAHNGFLDMYLNLGLFGVGLFIITLATAFHRLTRELRSNGDFPALRLTFLVIAIVYSLSEAAFTTLAFLWFALLIALVRMPAKTGTMHLFPLRFDSSNAAFVTGIH